MLLKISLGLAILVGLATLYFTMPLSDKITGLTTDLASAKSSLDESQKAEAKAKDDAKKTKTILEATTKDLNTATNFLTQVTARLAEQEKRANKSAADLVTVTEERNEARQELNKWQVIGMAPEKIRDEIDARKRLQAERDALKDENKTLSRNVTGLQTRLRRYEPDGSEVVLPPGTKGKVVAVDPKYDFVVLDIGGNQGLVEDAKMLVNRDGKLVAKVKITHVEPSRAIANIMPEWKQDDIVEGDQVIY